MLVAVADGVSQIEEFGIDASELPNELLQSVEELALNQLLPGHETEDYCGPISLVREAYESTSSMGSTTVLTAIMDNSTKIHGKLHPMIAVCSIGDCEILILRRGSDGHLTPIFHTEMQRIDGNAQQPLQIARVDETVDPDFDESIAIEVIEHGSAVHCVSAYEGDIVVAGSDGVFDNLFIDEIVSLVDSMIPSSGEKFRPISGHLLEEVAHSIVMESHAKSNKANGHMRQSPIGPGGKIDDTSCLIGQVLEFTPEQAEEWAKLRNRKWWQKLFNWPFATCSH
jgi:protein phosphatase PTC7